MNFSWTEIDLKTKRAELLWNRGCLDNDFRKRAWKTPSGGMQTVTDTIEKVLRAKHEDQKIFFNSTVFKVSTRDAREGVTVEFYTTNP